MRITLTNTQVLAKLLIRFKDDADRNRDGYSIVRLAQDSDTERPAQKNICKRVSIYRDENPYARIHTPLSEHITRVTM